MPPKQKRPNPFAAAGQKVTDEKREFVRPRPKRKGQAKSGKK